MPDETNENQPKPKSGLRTFLKVIGLTLVVVLAIIILGFGLIVGFCALGSR